MDFTTKVPVFKSAHPIGYNSKLLSLGSCFAANIAEKLDFYQFVNTANPFGILFHPPAIEKLIGMSLGGETFSESDIFFLNERWQNFDAHSDCSRAGKIAMLENLNTAISSLKSAVAKASHIVITLGTAWVYRHKASRNIVANCHKVPQREFSKELLSPGQIAGSVSNILSMLEKANPKAAVIFTISPVRHLKDGFAENQRSKANLISGLHEVLDAHVRANYFPSYEIVMDELRDYRFYAADLVHPNQMAIDFIWERFAESWISGSARPVMDEVAAIRKNLAHRAFNPESESHKNFIAANKLKIASLTARYPHMDFTGKP